MLGYSNDPFTAAMEEMLKDAGCRSLLTISEATHASFAFVRTTGIQSDVFRIGVMLFQNDAHFDKVAVLRSGLGSDDSFFIGKMVNSAKKPVAAVLNRNISGLPMTVIGPNRIYYDSLNGEEFKIYLPAGYAHQHSHPLSAAQPRLEIYCAERLDR